MTARDWMLVSIMMGAPVAIVLIVALVRGYTVTLHMTRDTRGRRANRSSDG